MVFCRIIVVIMSNLVQKITLNLLCSVPCYNLKVQQIFNLALQGNTSAIKASNLKELASKNGYLQNHCSYNAKSNFKDNNTFALLCSLLQGSKYFFWLKTFNSKQVGAEKSILKNHCSDNTEPSAKCNSENALLCSLLQGLTDLLVAFQRNKFSYQNLQFEISWFWKWYFAESS